jgi:hypothetical protein
MTFPVAARIYAADAADAGRRIGAIYSANVFGAIFGSVVAASIRAKKGVGSRMVLPCQYACVPSTTRSS